MDTINEALQQHREIGESMTFLKEFLAAFTRGKATDYSRKTKQFCDG